MRFPLLVLAAVAAILSHQGCHALRRGRGVNLNQVKDRELRFVKWLSHDGCVAFVWQGGSNDDAQQLWLEPTFCVPEPKHWLGDSTADITFTSRCASYDPVTNNSFVSVPVTLTNNTFLDGVAKRLAYLKPSSLRYLRVESVELKVNRSSKRESRLRFAPLGLSWSQSDQRGWLKFGCDGVDCSVLYRKIQASSWELLDPLMAVSTLMVPGSMTRLTSVSRAVAFQNAIHYSMPNLQALPTDVIPLCKEVVAEDPIDVSVGNGTCRLRIHRTGARVFAEPLLCYVGEARVTHDFNRGVRSLWLTLLLRSEAALRGARVEGRNVTFMRLMDPRPKISMNLREPEMRLGSDGNSMLIRLECGDETKCEALKSAVESDPLIIFTRIKWVPVFLIESDPPDLPTECRFEASDTRLSVPLEVSRAANRCPSAAPVAPEISGRLSCGAVHCQFVRLADGRDFLVAQQRRSASVKFDRKWVDYEIGFGDEHNFWIGLKNIAAMTQPRGTLMRIEAKLWNGTELYAEYSGVRLGVNRYNLTYGRYLRERSNTGGVNLLGSNEGTPFSTSDLLHPIWTADDQYYKRNYGYSRYPDRLKVFGYAGWWWPSNTTHANFNPNGVFHFGDAAPMSRDKESFVGMNVSVSGSECAAWKTEWTTLMLVRIMLEV